jgi:pantoate--beta-alanine ligase
MLIFKHTNAISSYLSKEKGNGKTIGFVPTMGALHQGHLSLINRSVKENNITVCSVFINPSQFNNKKDFENYPIDIDEDIKKLEKHNCTIVFIPSVDEIYPNENLKHQSFDFKGLDKYMEGAHRPGHFNGVAVVVKRLFEICIPHNAYFGEKDFQQLRIIQHVVSIHKMNTSIVPCEIYRELNGLAMSSRNRRLSKKEKEEASSIHRIMTEAKKEFLSGIPLKTTKKKMTDQFLANKLFSIDYIEYADSKSLKPIQAYNETTQCILCIAVYVNDVRLIDNIGVF